MARTLVLISRSLWSREVRVFKIHLYWEKVPFNFRQLCDPEALLAVCEHYFFLIKNIKFRHSAKLSLERVPHRMDKALR